MNYQMMVMSLLPLIALLNFMLHKAHFLHLLLCLEIITLSMLMFLSMGFLSANIPAPLISVVVLTLGACEASLGLTLLVLMVRLFGNDLMKNISLSKC
uniref:NADH-ubiquinone oxidoreductase chain 4L n=1 Tax=Placobdella lamothei TaxID=1514856 RepID=A0A175D637_9ANNE|nr:NADH dehydrogenase subunit 4L [Placobdella lamothei]CVK87334.1 NADH dehydrogenase subunit 4L [Placobdella lamothei]